MVDNDYLSKLKKIKNYMKLAPIAVFAYNRPLILLETLEALTANKESIESVLYVFCDGAKVGASDKEIQLINEVRAVVKQKQWCKEVIVYESEINHGLSKAIIGGVNQILDKHDRIIVLEDDLVVSPFFLNYMNTALDLYKENESVISIVGYNYPLTFSEDFPETYFLKNADCLGWGTWKRGWNLFEKDARVLLNQIENMNAKKEFDFDNQYPYIKMLKKVAEGTVNSWAIRWYASGFVNNLVTLFPKKSLVRHIGHIGSNVKADNSDVFGWEISMEKVTYFEKNTDEIPSNRLKLSKHFRKYNRRRLTLSSIKYAYKRFILSNFNS